MANDERKTTDGCWPPEGTADGTRHFLSAEIGDGSKRGTFTATWEGGLWKTRAICGLSPRKAAWATWLYEGCLTNHHPDNVELK